MNMQKYTNNNLLLLNPKIMTNMHFCPEGPAICKISQKIVMKWGNSEQENFQMISFLVSFKSYRCFMSSFFFFFIVFSEKQPERSLSFTCNSLFKHVSEIVIAPQLAKVRPSSVKIGEHRTHGIQQQQINVDIFLHIYILLRKSFPLIDNGNPTVVSDMVSKSIFSASKFWTNCKN